MVKGLEFVTDAFQGSPIEQASLYVPVSMIELYKSLEPWRNFGSIVPLDDVDGVVSIHKDCSDSTPIFDLQGRRLTQKPAKGMYIQDGKKVVVKWPERFLRVTLCYIAKREPLMIIWNCQNDDSW